MAASTRAGRRKDADRCVDQPAESSHYSPKGPLTHAELGLIDLLGNSLLLDRLLPEKAVAVGESWKQSSSLVCDLLGLDAVTESDVQSTLVSVAQETELGWNQRPRRGDDQNRRHFRQHQGKYRFQLDTGRIVWFGILVKVNRASVTLGPGRRQPSGSRRRSPGADAPRLADAALKIWP